MPLIGLQFDSALRTMILLWMHATPGERVMYAEWTSASLVIGFAFWAVSHTILSMRKKIAFLDGEIEKRDRLAGVCPTQKKEKEVKCQEHRTEPQRATFRK
jgi:hypothetical protein